MDIEFERVYFLDTPCKTKPYLYQIDYTKIHSTSDYYINILVY